MAITSASAVAASAVAASAASAPAVSAPAAPVRSRARLHDRLGVWVFAVVCMVILPLFPIFVEIMKTGDVKPDSYLLTTVVLAVGYGFTSLHMGVRGVYLLLFFFSLILSYNPSVVLSPPSWPTFIADFGTWVTYHPALTLVILVTAVHSVERFVWHVVLNQLFPDWQN
jgi:hypothetical protein